MQREQWIKRLVRYQYLEDFLHGRRVLEVGCGAGRGAEYLAQRAAQVVAIDTSSVLLSKAKRAFHRRNLEFVVAEPDRLQHSDDHFDVVLVPELERWITRGALIPELRRVLKPEGIAAFAVPAEDSAHGMEYNDLLEYLGSSFEHTRMVGQIPFNAAILADFAGEDEIEPLLDCSLVAEDEPPEHYLALCSEHPLASVGYSVVQFQDDASEHQRLREADRALEQARRETERAEVRADRAMLELKVMEQAAKNESQQGAQLKARVRQLELELGAAGGEESVEALRAMREQRDAYARRLAEFERERSERGDDDQREQHGADIEVLREQLADAERRVLEVSAGARQELTAARRQVRAKEEQLALVSEELRRARARLAGEDELEFESDRQTVRAEPSVDADIADAIEQALEETEAETPDEAGELHVAELKALLERERAHNDALRDVLEQERRRLDQEHAKVSAGEQGGMRARAEIETMRVRMAAAEQALAESRAAAEEQRRRAERAERRCDGLVNRVEQDAAELSRLHQRLAEMQGLRQSDVWRLDELTGRLREAESRLGAAASSGGEGDDAPAPQTGQARELARRCESLQAALQQRDAELRVALRAADKDALQDLRARTEQVKRLEQRLQEQSAELQALRERGSGDPADGQEALAQGRREIELLRQRVGTAESEAVKLRLRLALVEREGEAVDSEIAERLASCQQQLEMLREGALVHRQQSEQLQARIDELAAHNAELTAERDRSVQQLGTCRGALGQRQDQIEALRRQLAEGGRELARVQGLLKRCQAERAAQEPSSPA
jgi:SAM-dependent methyltransferase